VYVWVRVRTHRTAKASSHALGASSAAVAERMLADLEITVCAVSRGGAVASRLVGGVGSVMSVRIGVLLPPIHRGLSRRPDGV